MGVSLVLSIFGTVTGVSALLWQAVMWRRSGPVVTAEAELHGVKDNVYIFCVTARNLGRSPISVTMIHLGDFTKEEAEYIRPISNIIKAPCRLEGGSAESWIIAVPAGRSLESTVVFNVVLANKKSIRIVKAVPPIMKGRSDGLVFGVHDGLALMPSSEDPTDGEAPGEGD